MIKSLVDIGDAAALEEIERDAMLDIWRAVDSDAASYLHIAHAERAGMALTAMRGFDFGLFNRAQGLGCRGPVAEAEVVEAVAWLRTHCAPSWRLQVVPASADEDFDARATSLGLSRKGSGAAKMYRDASPVPQPESKPGFEVRPVTGDGASACLRTCADGFGLPPPVIAAMGVNLVERPRWRAYAAYDDGEPVAFGLTFMEGEWAWLGWGSTLPAYRGKGAQSALLRRRVADGLAHGVRNFAVECAAPSDGDGATSTSYRNAVRVGFSQAYTRVAYGPA